jgi:hypothetical protein
MSQTFACTGVLALMSTGSYCPPPSLPAFEVATIKVEAPTEGGGRTSTSGDRFVYSNTTLLNALAFAFQVKSSEQIIGPS